MKIFEEKGKIRLQLMNMPTNTMLFDFTVEKEDYGELVDHIVTHLKGFKVE